ncbi:Myb-like_DNA-binding domain-containing protein [Hexamita inflata]|uniref:Myb-like DNA-binding domain-containing protein n=1 Tax=Hexamita inflata TaxID=28002 RepID=A0AA86QMK0_9EUKA|nr:Myb-like DNA-binding domain-containing protein [Hexamita inflata]
MSKRQLTKWSEEEQQLFDQLLLQYKRNFKMIAQQIPNRSYNQVRSHYYNEVNKTGPKLVMVAQSQDNTNDIAENDLYLKLSELLNKQVD